MNNLINVPPLMHCIIFSDPPFVSCWKIVTYPHLFIAHPTPPLFCTSLFLVERLPRNNFDFIWFSFLTSLAFIQVYIWRLLRSVCYMFYGKNHASPYKCSKVELICSACVRRKTVNPRNGYHMDGTGSSETNIYSSGAHVTVDGVTPIYPQQKFEITVNK